MAQLSLNLSGPPQQVYSPPLSGRGHVQVTNLGSAPVYVSSAGALATTSGVLVPQDGSLSFPVAAAALFASSGNAITFGAPATSLAGNAAAGAGTVVLTSITGFATPATFAIGTATALEWVTATGYPGGGTAVLAAATVLDHVSGSTVRTFASQVPSPVTVTLGVT